MAIGKKNNAADRPGPRYHRPQGVMQRALKCQPNQFGRCIITGQMPVRLDLTRQSKGCISNQFLRMLVGVAVADAICSQ